MTNSLCDADVAGCIGFAASSGCGPQYPVVCYGGNPVVEKLTACKPYEASNSTVYGTAMSTTIDYFDTLLELVIINPFCVESIVHVSHEFGAKITVSPSDAYAIRGDISCSGMALFSGGTGGMFTVEGHNGSAMAASALVYEETIQRNFEATYVLAASATATVRQQVVLNALDIRGFNRVINNMNSVMKVLIFPRQT